MPLFESNVELFLCFVQPSNEPDLILVHGLPLEQKAPFTNLVALVLLPFYDKMKKSVVSFKYEQHSEFPRSFYTSEDWPEVCFGKFDGKFTSFFNQGVNIDIYT